MSVTVLTSRKKGLSVTVPDHNHRDLQEIVLERAGYMEEDLGLIIISLFCKSNTEENPSFVLKSLIAK